MTAATLDFWLALVLVTMVVWVSVAYLWLLWKWGRV